MQGRYLAKLMHLMTGSLYLVNMRCDDVIFCEFFTQGGSISILCLLSRLSIYPKAPFRDILIYVVEFNRCYHGSMFFNNIPKYCSCFQHLAGFY